MLTAEKRKCPTMKDRAFVREWGGVTDGARTHDNRSHSPGLYQLSYDHQ